MCLCTNVNCFIVDSHSGILSGGDDELTMRKHGMHLGRETLSAVNVDREEVGSESNHIVFVF